jgi:hypothetical protein
MSGGAASAKTANYVLVAADAGTAISMTSTSATTITVNTGLFAAGDTVFIQNLGSATCTITAGTATVNTAGSLILPQYDAGILYFVSSSSAVFYDYIQVGATSPLTTKGDLYGFGTSDARIPIGTNGHILTADSAQTLGLKWAAPAGGGSGLTLIDEVSFTSSNAVNVNDVFSSTYNNYKILLLGTVSAATVSLRLRVSGTDTTTNYEYVRLCVSNGTVQTDVDVVGNDEFFLGSFDSSNPSPQIYDMFSPFATDKTSFYGGGGGVNINNININAGTQTDSTSFTGFSIICANGMTGKVSVYGYAKE